MILCQDLGVGLSQIFHNDVDHETTLSYLSDVLKFHIFYYLISILNQISLFMRENTLKLSTNIPFLIKQLGQNKSYHIEKTHPLL